MRLSRNIIMMRLFDRICVLLFVIADASSSRAEYRGTIRRNKRRSAGMRVLCVPWKRDIPLDLALGRTIDTRARRVAILEHVRKTHTHGFAGMRSGMCDLVVCNDRQIDSHGCANQGLIGGIAWSRPARKWKLRGSMREVSRTAHVSRIARDSISRYDGR